MRGHGINAVGSNFFRRDREIAPGPPAGPHRLLCYPNVPNGI